jgi:hypothetical protein
MRRVFLIAALLLSGCVSEASASYSLPEILTTTKTLSKDGTGADCAIVGTGAGALGATAGCTLVAAVANKVIIPVSAHVFYTRATASYTGGGNARLSYSTASGLVSISATVSAAYFFTLTTSNSFFLTPTLGSGDDLTGTASGLVNAPVILRSDAAITNPGTAAGTAVVKTVYYLLDAP